MPAASGELDEAVSEHSSDFKKFLENIYWNSGEFFKR